MISVNGTNFMRVLVAAVLVSSSGTPAQAEVTRLEIESRDAYDGGREFGERGSYERLRGTIHFAIDPEIAANGQIVDVELAPRSERGQVEFSAGVEILAPRDRGQANGAILYDVNNRGNRVCLGQFNGGGADGFLMRQGFIVVWSGWIAELLQGNNRLLLDVPVASKEGGPIRGPVRAEFSVSQDTPRKTIAHWDNHGSYRPSTDGLEQATLTWRLNERDPRVPIPRNQFRLHQADIDQSGRQTTLPLIEIEVAGGIKAGYLYELIYEAEGPLVQGLGLAGIRDLVSFLKHSKRGDNPLKHRGASVAEYAYGFGVSQSGRCLRTFLYDGFNADENGNRVFDGMIPHVAGAGMGYFNHRFASPTRHNSQHDNHQYPADVFPFAYGEERDVFTERVDSLLGKAVSDGVAPKIMHTQSSSEYWHRAGSLVHTDPASKRDSEIPANVRIYTFGGTQHGAGSGRPQPGGAGQLVRNPADYRPFMRALLLAMDAWVRRGSAPPASVYPRIADGSLVDFSPASTGWQPLPGVRYPEIIHQPDFLDRGPHFLTKRQVAWQPPRLVGRYKVLVPACGPDNNELGCLMLPSVAVPVATYTSWNLRARETGAETELLSLAGGYIPFAITTSERVAIGDPRLSLQERYGDFATYLDQYSQHVARLLQAGYVLDEDLPRMMALAESNRSLFNW